MKENQRYAAVDLSQVKVVRAHTDDDFEAVAEIRRSGFSRIPGVAQESQQWLDGNDRLSGTYVLLGYDSVGRAIATMRVQDERVAPLDLAERIDIDTVLSAEKRPAAQFGRLSSVKSDQTANVMFGLFKASWTWCREMNITTIVIATPRWTKAIYEFMMFKECGKSGDFNHEFAGGALHETMTLSVQEAQSIWRDGEHPLCKEFLEKEHPLLRF